MKRYIGITIGPIGEMMNLASTPVALWASSYIFSFLSKCLCEELIQDGIQEKDIIAPYYKADEPLLNKNDGVGLLYDRIIALAENYDIKQFSDVRERALHRLAENFNLEFEYVKAYIMVAAGCFVSDNPLVDGNRMLDSFELATPFVAKETENPILALFTGSKNGKNVALKNMPLFKTFQNFSLKKEDGTIVAIQDIANQGMGYKKFQYYAVVRADGDNVHKIVASLQDEEEMRAFSKNCLSYCSTISDLVAEFSGVTIYSGGDDLLAILPCENKQSQTPFHFAERANEIFHHHFSGYSVATSLSFGIVIDHYKTPLYDILAESANLLFGVAKNQNKNSVAVSLHKSSGQSEGLLIPNECLPEFVYLFDYVKISQESQTGVDTFVGNVAMDLTLYEESFNRAETETEVFNLFRNHFKSFFGSDTAFYFELLPALFNKMRLGNGPIIRSILEDVVTSDNPTQTMCFILRIFKFFYEKGGFEE